MRLRLLRCAPVLGLLACVEPLGTSVDQAEVIGGTLTPAGMYPSVGALYDSAQRAFFCTGTLIAPDAVLTAAHCLEGGAVPSFTFVHDTRTPLTALPGRSAIAHPSFSLDRNLGPGPQQYFDVAVVTLMAPVPGVTPTLLPSPAEAAMLTVGRQLELVGYGQTRDNDPSSGSVMFHGKAPIVAAGASELQISNPGGVQNCYGDSGGPALADLGGGPRVVGIVSRGATAAPTCNQGGLDTRVDAYVAWIKQQAPGACVSSDTTCNRGAGQPTGGTPGTPGGSDPNAPAGGERADVITGGCSAGGDVGGAALVLGLAFGLGVGLGVLRRRRGP